MGSNKQRLLEPTVQQAGHRREFISLFTSRFYSTKNQI